MQAEGDSKVLGLCDKVALRPSPRRDHRRRSRFGRGKDEKSGFRCVDVVAPVGYLGGGVY